MPGRAELLPLLRDITRRLNGNVTLDEIAKRAGWSKFHLHRSFRMVVGETPKAYVERLRLTSAAARLTVDDAPVVRVATEAGFASHAVFTRAFRRHFGSTPTAYRALMRRGARHGERRRHAVLAQHVAPCVHLFHAPVAGASRRLAMPMLSIERKEVTAQPVVFVRTKAARHEVAAAIGAALGKVGQHMMKAGLTYAGQPYSRYHSAGVGRFDMEIGIPVASAGTGDGEVKAGELPAGPAVVAIHGGPYDQLSETYAEVERWIEANGFATSGPPWEVYVTDPADHPDPADWRTQVCWPIQN